MTPKTIAYIQLSILTALILLFVAWLTPKEPEPQDVAVIDETVIRFPDVELEAKAAYVYDVLTGETLYELNSEIQWPLASLTKLMSALTASKLVPGYLLVKISADDLREEGDTGLLVDEEWNLRKLIDYSLLVSSNDGIKAIASVAGASVESSGLAPEAEFVERMNGLAKDIGLTETYFLNQSGLDVTSTLAGGYGSAKDVALLVDYILRNDPHLIEATSAERTTISSNNATHSATNTNRAILNIPNVIGSKTGYTELSGGNVVVAWNAGLDRPIIISVLGSTYDGRFSDLDKLVDATLRYLNERNRDI